MQITPSQVSPALGTPATAGGAGPWLPPRVYRIFTRPRELFREFGSDAPWAGALAISIMAGIIAIVALPDQILYEGMQGATTRRGVPVEITSSPAVVALFERVRLTMGVVASQPLLAVMLAGSLVSVFGWVLRWPAGFRQYFAIAVHAFLISAAGAVVVLVVRIVTMDWEWEARLGRLAGAFGVELPAHLSMLDPFTLWMLAVLGVGVAVVNGRRRVWLPAALLVAVYAGAIGAFIHYTG